MKSPDLDPTQASSYGLGWTFNPITGCLNGCSYCYARRLAHGRLKQKYLANKLIVPNLIVACGDNLDDPFFPRFWANRLDAPLDRQLKPSGIFVCNMGELFGNWIPEGWQRAVFRVFADCPQHRFYLLTKQPQNLDKWSPFPLNCYVGITIDGTNRTSFSGFANVRARVKYVSFEPLLASVANQLHLLRNAGIGWVIIGGQSGADRFYPPEQWIDEIKDACDEYQIPVFEKDNLRLSGARRQDVPE